MNHSGQIKRKAELATVLLCYFVAASIDLTGIATNYIKAELSLSDSQAGFIPSMMFVWFLLISIPSGLALNRFGHRKILLAALCILGAGMAAILPCHSYWTFLLAVGIMGIGSTVLSVALNPSVAALVPKSRLASTLTAGNSIKAVASLLAPLLAAWGAVAAGGWLGWKLPYGIFLAVLLVAAALLSSRGVFSGRGNSACEGVRDDMGESESAGKGAATLADCIRLLRRPAILAAFVAIVCHVGSDTGINIIAPQLLIRRAGFTLDMAAPAASLYFFCRLAGTLAGIYLLRVIKLRPALLISLGMLAAGLAGAFLAKSPAAIYASIALLGLGNANVYTLILTQAMLNEAGQENNVSALMPTGVAGGAIFPPLMGLASDAFGLAGAIAVIAICIIGVLIYAFRLAQR